MAEETSLTRNTETRILRLTRAMTLFPKGFSKVWGAMYQKTILIDKSPEDSGPRYLGPFHQNVLASSYCLTAPVNITILA